MNAFWSVTMYDGKTQFLIKKPINRYLINSPMLRSMKMNADGSLTLYIQNKSPGADKEANWLPAPDGPIYLVMRLYWRKTTPPSILPPGEGTWKPPAVEKVNTRLIASTFIFVRCRCRPARRPNRTCRPREPSGPCDSFRKPGRQT